MIYFASGVVLLAVLLVVGRAFLSAKPETILQFLTWFGIFAAIALVLALIESGLFLPLVLVVGIAWIILLPRARETLQRWMGVGAAGAGGRVSEVETEYLRMSLEHATGTMTGTVRKGRFQGRRLEELDVGALIALWREVRAEDSAAVSLLESYLDQFMPDWRGRVSGSGPSSGAPPPGPSGTMTREEAYAVLGLKSGAGAAEIKEAHHRLMMKIHPDQGGSDVLAAQVNRAKDILLGD